MGSVVAFSHAVHVEAARLLVERFYRELCAGRIGGPGPGGSARSPCAPPPPAGSTAAPTPPPSTCRTGLSPSCTRWARIRCWSEHPHRRLPASAEQRARRAPPRAKRPGRGRRLPQLSPASHATAFKAAPWSCSRWSAPTAATPPSCSAAWAAWARPPWPARPRPGGCARAALRPPSLPRSRQASAPSARCSSWARRWRATISQLAPGRRPVGQAAVRPLSHPARPLVWDNFESTLPAFQKNPAAGAELIDAPQLHRRGPRPAAPPLPRADAASATHPSSPKPRPQGRLPAGHLPPDRAPACRASPSARCRGWPGPTALPAGLGAGRQGHRHRRRRRYTRGPRWRPCSTTLADHPLSIELVAPHLKTLTPAPDRGRL